MTFTIQIVSLISALGIGSVIGIVIKHILDRNAELKIRLKIINEEKYKNVLIYMSILITPKNKDHFVLNDSILYSLKTDSEIKEYAMTKLKAYYFQSLLYASDEVMRSFKLFLADPDKQKYIVTAQKMRADLWNNKTTLTVAEI